MDHDLLALFEDGLRRFNRERYSAALLVQYAQAGTPYSAELWAEMRELGWFEALRGDDGRAVAPLSAIVPIFRAAGEGLWREPVAAVLGEAAAVLAQMPDTERRAALLEGLISGAAPLVCASREAGDGWGAAAIGTLVRRGPRGPLLQGCKRVLADAESAAGYLVLARDADTQRTAFYRVERGAPGVLLQACRAVDGRGIATLHLADVEASEICPGEAAPRASAWAAILAAAEAVGIMRGANADTAEYLRQRRQFGRPLLSFQVLQHRLVEMHMLERETDALLMATVEAFDADAPALPRRLLVLRAQASRALRQVTREAVQMHGGMGVTEELRIAHYYRRALVLDSLHGSEDWALQSLAAA